MNLHYYRLLEFSCKRKASIAGKVLSSIFIAYLILLTSCENSPEPSPPVKTISYVEDGRTVKQGDPSPIAIDLNADGSVDFTVFVELHANSSGDYLNTGINPIGANLIKSGPPNDNRFLNMGLLIAEPTNAIINYDLHNDQQWTGEHSALVIRHTHNDGSISYEGSWSDNSDTMVGIQHKSNDQTYFGWLRLKFDRLAEVVTLIDYAYEKKENQSIKAGDH